MAHIPVLAKEVLRHLEPKPGENFVDATLGGGGHAVEILKQTAPNGLLFGIDLSKAAIEAADEKFKATGFGERAVLARGNFSDLKKIAKENNFSPIHGILADLGFSSIELEQSGRGFSFLRDEPLDMRFGEEGQTASEIINLRSEKELADIFWRYGEESFSRQIADKIVGARKIKPIVTTFELLEAIKQATPVWYHHKKIHPATKTFQALRIAVNDELGYLEKFLPQAIDILESGGRLAVISFHSLEDRLVKNFFKDKQKEGVIKIITKKAARPDISEIKENPRARSAKLRVALKI